VQFLFGDHVLDVDRRELRSSSELIATEPQVFDILVFLLQNHDRVVSKHELIEEVWGGRIVSESTVSSRITAVRKAVGDGGKRQRLIRTLPRRGFRFVGAVRQVPAPAASAMPFADAATPIASTHRQTIFPRDIAASESTRRAAVTPDQPAIAVLPFVNWSRDPRQDCFAGGMTEEITAGLSRLHWLSVIACNSSSDHMGKPADVRQLARELGVRYAVEGSIWAVGESIRVITRLLDPETGRRIWAEKYDRRLDDVFLVQDEISESVVAAVEAHLYAQEGVGDRGQATERLDASGYFVRARPLVMRLTPESNAQAQRLLHDAIAVEPAHAGAHALLALAYWWEAHCWWTEEVGATFERALSAGERAVGLDPRDPWVRLAYGIALSSAGDHRGALGHFGAALEYNPSFAFAHGLHGLASVRAGRFEEAVRHTHKALRMCGADALAGFYASQHGHALFYVGRFDEAAELSRKALVGHPNLPGRYNVLIGCCGYLGLHEEARQTIERRNRIGPLLRANTLLYNQHLFANSAMLAEGMRKAGVPD
jgi:adenylate cyclase